MNNELEKLRKQIDDLDDRLLEIIAERIKLMKMTGIAKRELNKPLRDLKREEKKINYLIKRSKELDIPVNIITKIWKIFFETSSEIEK